MLLQLGQGWWFRSMKYGSDAWVAFTDIDPVHVGVVNVKVSEGLTASSDDIDAYVLFASVEGQRHSRLVQTSRMQMTGGTALDSAPRGPQIPQGKRRPTTLA